MAQLDQTGKIIVPVLTNDGVAYKIKRRKRNRGRMEKRNEAILSLLTQASASG